MPTLKGFTIVLANPFKPECSGCFFSETTNDQECPEAEDGKLLCKCDNLQHIFIATDQD